MTQSLYINKKKYLPSTVLSKQFGYSSDYISRLAREEKILATRVGRLWFVEPESLNTFFIQTDIEKRMRHDLLQIERRVDRLKKLTKKTSLEHFNSEPLQALVQASLVLVCGVFVGALSWMSVSAELSISDFAFGTKETLALVSESVVSKASLPTIRGNVQELFNESGSVSRTSFLMDNARSSVLQNKSEGTFTSLPQITDWNNSGEFNFPINIHNQFSDEVMVTYDSDNSVVVQPIFKSGVGGVQGFLLVPVDVDSAIGN